MNLRVYSREVHLQTRSSFEFVDITEIIAEEVERSQISAGIVLVNVLHTTAALIVQEGDELVHEDARQVLERLAPINLNYRHAAEGPINGAAHQKQQLLGGMCVLPICNGKLTLGVWQRLFLVELFKPLQRRLQITLLGAREDE